MFLCKFSEMSPLSAGLHCSGQRASNGNFYELLHNDILKNWRVETVTVEELIMIKKINFLARKAAQI